MKLIVGLGNPGIEFKDNRHNVGDLIIDILGENKLPKNIIIKKTNVFMNESGEIVRKLVDQYHLNTSDLWVIHDDLDIPLGSYKIQKGKGPKLHNGINSIERELGTDEFWRVRVGVDNRKSNEKISGEDYVLQDFSDDETLLLKPIINEICKKLATS